MNHCLHAKYFNLIAMIMKKIYLETYNGHYYATNAYEKDMWEFAAAFNDRWKTLMIWEPYNRLVVKATIKRTLLLEENEVIEKINRQPQEVQDGMRAVIEWRRKDWKPVNSWDHLLEIYKLKKRDGIWSLCLPFYTESAAKILPVKVSNHGWN